MQWWIIIVLAAGWYFLGLWRAAAVLIGLVLAFALALYVPAEHSLWAVIGLVAFFILEICIALMSAVHADARKVEREDKAAHARWLAEELPGKLRVARSGLRRDCVAVTRDKLRWEEPFVQRMPMPLAFDLLPYETWHAAVERATGQLESDPEWRNAVYTRAQELYEARWPAIEAEVMAGKPIHW